MLSRSTQRGRHRAWGLIVASSVVAVLAACTPRVRLDVSTTTVKPSGRCDTARVVEVGATLPLSGLAAPLAHEYLTGLELGVAHVNGAGGVLGSHRCLELVYKDDRGDDQLAARAVADLVNDETVAFLIGPAWPAQIHAAGAGLAHAGIPTSGWSGLDTTFLPAQYPWMFPVGSSNATVVSTMASYASSQQWSRVGLVDRRRVDAEGVAAFTAAARRDGITVVGQLDDAPGHDMTAGLAQLRRAGAEGLVVLDDTTDVTSVLEARARLSWAAPVVSTAITTDATVVEHLRPSSLAGVAAVVPQPLVLQPGISTATVRGFRDAVRRALHTTRLDGSVVTFAQAYDAVTMLASTANSVHSTSPTSLRTFLESAGYEGLLASYTYTTASHTGIPANQLTVVPLAALSDGLFAPSG